MENRMNGFDPILCRQRYGISVKRRLLSLGNVSEGNSNYKELFVFANSIVALLEGSGCECEDCDKSK